MKIQCPHCNTTVNAESEHFGKNVECPSCSKDFIVSELEPAHCHKSTKISEKIKDAKSKRIYDVDSAYNAKQKQALKPETEPSVCHYCKQNINSGATKCNHCGSILTGGSLSGIFLALFVVISFIAGIASFAEAADMTRNAQSAIHQIYGELIYLRACICMAASFIVWGLSGIMGK